jgi:hypothetical protein
MQIEISILEAYQIQAALERRLAVLARGEHFMEPGSLEAAMVESGIRYTGSALTSLTALLYGEDDPDMPEVVSELVGYYP